MIKDWGFMWITSDHPLQQDLLKVSIELAKRLYPEIPRLVLSKDSSLQVDADIELIEALHSDPDCDVAYHLSKSPFNRTVFLCNKSMITSRFEHLLHECAFEASVKSAGGHTYLQTPYRVMNNILNYSKQGIELFDAWLHRQNTEWQNSDHIITWYHRDNCVMFNYKLVAEQSCPREDFLNETFQSDLRSRICGTPIDHWLNFPIFDLSKDYDVFKRLFYIGRYQLLDDSLTQQRAITIGNDL
jgi:hypothetical protein